MVDILSFSGVLRGPELIHITEIAPLPLKISPYQRSEKMSEVTTHQILISIQFLNLFVGNEGFIDEASDEIIAPNLDNTVEM